MIARNGASWAFSLHIPKVDPRRRQYAHQLSHDWGGEFTEVAMASIPNNRAVRKPRQPIRARACMDEEDLWPDTAHPSPERSGGVGPDSTAGTIAAVRATARSPMPPGTSGVPTSLVTVALRDGAYRLAAKEITDAAGPRPKHLCPGGAHARPGQGRSSRRAMARRPVPSVVVFDLGNAVLKLGLEFSDRSGLFEVELGEIADGAAPLRKPPRRIEPHDE